ncbi:MAG TPA: ABC transporter permease [Tepidisphaeraceae bacterium]|jgi:ABC-type polysaccharide/polyol phosphate export permease
MVHGLYQYRGFIWERALADLRHRYAGTGLGVVWNVLHPLAMIGLYSLIFSTLMPARLPGVNERFGYVLYLCCGFLPWLAFSECVTRGTVAFLENAAYLRKLPMPEQVFVAQCACAATMGLGISFSMLVIISLIVGHRPTAYWLLLPIPLILLQATGFAIGLLLGTLNVFFRDVGQLVQIALQVLFWTVPVVWMPQFLPAAWRPLLHWHPLVPMFDGIRDLFLFNRVPPAGDWILMLAWPAAFLLLAYAAFRSLRREIRDLL